MKNWISATILMASDPKNRPQALQVLEGFHAGWHEWEWCKRQFPKLIAERQRMIDAGELTPTSGNRSPARLTEPGS